MNSGCMLIGWDMLHQASDYEISRLLNCFDSINIWIPSSSVYVLEDFVQLTHAVNNVYVGIMVSQLMAGFRQSN